MANTRTYTIQIEGLTAAYDGVKSLLDVLNQLSDKNIKVSSSTEALTDAENKQKTAIEQTAKSARDKASANDALSKAQEKLNSYDQEYEKQLAAVKAELSANQKEIKNQLKIQEAQATVEAKQLDTYKDKQNYLSALNTLIRNHSTATEEDNDAIRAMVEESAALQNELKAIDEQMEIYSRNVGNYNEAAEIVTESHQSLKQQLREVKDEMAQMLMDGVSKTDEGFIALAERAGQIKDAMADAGDEISHFASDTSGIDNVINLASTATAGFSLYQSTMAAFGIENDEVAQSMQRLMAAMSALQALQQLQNNLTANGSATAKIYSTVVDGLKNYFGLKTAAVEADNAATETSIALGESEIVVEDSKTASLEAQTAVKETALATDEASLAVKEGMVAAETGVTVAIQGNTGAETANTTATQTNTTAKQTNTTATTTMSTANKTATATQTGLSTAQKAGAVASRILGTAMKAIPLFAIIGLVTTLIDKWEDIWNWFKNTFPVLGQLSKAFDGVGGVMTYVKGVAIGLGKAVIHWISNPWKTLFSAIKEVLKGNFSKAVDILVSGLKNQFTGFGEEFKKGFNGAVEAGKEAVELEKQSTAIRREREMLEAKGLGNSKRARELEQQEYELKKKNAKTDEDRHQLEVEHQKERTKFRQADEQAAKSYHSKETGRIKSRQSTRTAAHNQAQKEAKEREDAAKKAEEERKKAAEEYQKRIDDIVKRADTAADNSQKKVDDVYMQSLETRSKWLKDSIDDFIKTGQELFAQGATDAFNEIAPKIVDFVNYMKNIQLTIYGEGLKKIQNDIRTIGNELTVSLNAVKDELFNVLPISDDNYYLELFTELDKQYKETTDDIKKGELNEQINGLVEEMQEIERKNAFNIYNDLKQQYENATDTVKKNELAKAIQKQAAFIFKATGENRERLYEQYVDLTKQLSSINEAAIAQLGKWASEPIDVPVSFNFSKLQNDFNTALDDIARQYFTKSRSKGLSVYEMFLALDEDPGALPKEVQEAIENFENGLESEAPVIQKELAKVFNFKIGFNTVFDTLIGGSKDLFTELNAETTRTTELLDKFVVILKTVGASENEIEKITNAWGDSSVKVEELKENLMDLVRGSHFYIDATSNEGRKAFEQFKKFSEDIEKQIYTGFVKSFDDAIKVSEASIKDFEKTFRDISLQPVRKPDFLSDNFGGDIIDKGATVQRYKDALMAAEAYYNAVKEGGQLREEIEEQWQAKLELTRKAYGISSKEYLAVYDQYYAAMDKMVDETKKANKDVADSRKKLRDADNEYYEDLSKRMKTVADAIFDNVINPISETFSALFTMELDEMNEFLEKLEKALEDATSLREESANRIEEINSQLRDSDAQNLDALRQRLADEEVLLTERQAMERRLQLEKEDQERRIEQKEKQQKKAEMLQSMFEGIANTAVGVTAALKYGPILGPIFAAIVGAMGAAQVAIISAQINKLADGGLLIGPSHSQGGMRVQGTNIEVEGGEYVINKRSTRKYLPLLEQINAEGRSGSTFKPISKFAQGGRLNIEKASRVAEFGLSERVFGRALKNINMRPQVSVVDINRVNQELTNVEVLAGRTA